MLTFDCNSCPIKEQLEDLRERNNEAHKEFYNRLAVIDKENVAIKKDIESINISIDKFDKSTKEFISKIDEIKLKPVKQYDHIKNAVISAIAGGLIGIVIAKLFS